MSTLYTAIPKKYTNKSTTADSKQMHYAYANASGQQFTKFWCLQHSLIPHHFQHSKNLKTGLKFIVIVQPFVNNVIYSIKKYSIVQDKIEVPI